MKADTLVIRTPSGLSGDMLLCGLARLAGLNAADLEQRVSRIGSPALAGALSVQPRSVAGISGWSATVTLREEHAHRGVGDILEIIDCSSLAMSARAVARAAFERLASVEAEVHGIAVEQVRFHEVGALDSILDMCLVSELFAELGSPSVVCSALPVSDGVVRCQHGLLATPAPAVLRMLEGIPVYGVAGAGELVTPTALALLHALGSSFGEWPPMTILRTARVYGKREFAGIPNGALFALGTRTASPNQWSREAQQSAHAHSHSHGPEAADTSPDHHG